uniref:BRCT domain-containing protein n=1 Tax=Monopterus albus TaxID=43700 RepID=A0A3Q3IJF7_MONAL
MTTSNNKCSVLQDVVAYVDVWSSDKTANYSKPFVQQLQEMGAQVAKRFNKHVTHVVFHNGHSATWRRAKESDVRLVSVLWVGRCFDDGVHADEELYPALNDESNPHKRHRCMQPKDSPVRTPQNDWRMRKKLEKMKKALPPVEPLVTDVSPIIIDEENGIIYSPSMKRSEYMAKRLKDMKENQKNLSPTDSQMNKSCSPSELKPSLGSTPTFFKLMCDQSDDDSCASAAECGYLPSAEEKMQVDVTDHVHVEKWHRKGSEIPSPSPCPDVPKWMSSPLKCLNFSDTEDEEENRPKKSRRTSVRKNPAEKHKSTGLLESPCQERSSDSSKSFHKDKGQSQLKCSGPSFYKFDKGDRQFKADISFTKTKTQICSGSLNYSSCLSSSTTLTDAAVELSKETVTPAEETPQKATPSLSTSAQSFNRFDESESVVSGCTVRDDCVFEDYFSPANHHQRVRRPHVPNLCEESDTEIPFELAAVPKKRKRRNENTGSENSKKKSKLEEYLPTLNSPRAPSGTTNDALKQRRASTSEQLTVLTEANMVLELQKNSDVSVLSQTLKSRGNECTVAAGVTEIPSGDKKSLSKQDSFSLQKTVNKTKAMRTLVMTSMPSEKQNTVVQVVKVLGGFSVVDRVCESTTHVVSGGHRRTLNILLGIARGCWILSFEWILWCLEQRQWIPEEPYELSDQFPAAQICRLQRHLSAGEHQQDLFQNQPAMFVSQHSQPPTQSLVELIQLCGGTICKTVRQAGICIGKYSGRRPEGCRILSEQWVLDCITYLKQLSYDKYDLE